MMNSKIHLMMCIEFDFNSIVIRDGLSFYILLNIYTAISYSFLSYYYLVFNYIKIVFILFQKILLAIIYLQVCNFHVP